MSSNFAKRWITRGGATVASAEPEVAIVGGGIGGLTLALALHDLGITCRVFEAADELAPVGVGINVLPHASEILCRLGLEDVLADAGVTTRESAFYNRFGQLIYREPAGRFAGARWPQFSLHRGDLQSALADAVLDRLGEDAIVLGHRCVGVDPSDDAVHLRFTDEHGAERPPVTAAIAVGCDGVHSEVRRQLFPDATEQRYTGVHMWRGVTRWKPFLTGATMVRAGWLSTGKMVIYPIRDDIDDEGRQLVNWVAELEQTRHQDRDWNRRGDIDDFIGHFAEWNFDWLDVPAMIRAADVVLEYPMVDQAPLPRWTVGRVTLLGDAAHAMVPRGSNGAGQAILDARELADQLAAGRADLPSALLAYEAERRPATSAIVELNRVAPPDAVLREVYERSGDRPFESIDDLISLEEMQEITDRYREKTGQRPMPTAPKS